MVKWACDPGLLLVQAAWKNLTWESWIAKCRGSSNSTFEIWYFQMSKRQVLAGNLKIVWGIDSSFWKSSFSCSILCVHIPYISSEQETLLFRLVKNYTTKNRRLSKNIPHTLGTYPRFPSPTVYAGGNSWEFGSAWGPQASASFYASPWRGRWLEAWMKNSEMTSSRTDIFIE